MNYKYLFQAENFAQLAANMSGKRMMIYKPRNRDSYEVCIWDLHTIENENFVSEVSPVSWGF